MNTTTLLNRRHLLALAAGLGLCSVQAAQAQGALGEAINKAGRQRMLSQRISKAWLAVGQQVEPQRAEKVLGDSVGLFERQLTELKNFAPTPEIRSTYARLETTWTEFRTLAASRPSQGSALQLLGLDAQVLGLAHQGTQQLELHAGKPVSQLINVAGRQRMLSQRLAKLHLATTWKTAGAEATAQISQAKQEFVHALEQLEKAQLTNSAIQHQLTLARQQWMFFDAALARVDSPAKRDAENVFVASENILQVMDQITELYVRLGA